MTGDDLDRHARAAETKKRRTRERITAATLDLFDPQSIGTLPTLEKIAEQAGIGVATLYSHFNTKYELYSEVLGQLLDPLIRPVQTSAKLGTYAPTDLRAEIVSYVCQVAILLRSYRYLVAAYVQSYFESRIYDESSGRRLSQPIVVGLGAVINFGRGIDSRFRSDGIEGHMDALLLAACMRERGNGLPMTSRGVARGALHALLPEVDENYRREEFQVVAKQIDFLIPEEQYDN